AGPWARRKGDAVPAAEVPERVAVWGEREPGEAGAAGTGDPVPAGVLRHPGAGVSGAGCRAPGWVVAGGDPGDGAGDCDDGGAADGARRAGGDGGGTIGQGSAGRGGDRAAAEERGGEAAAGCVHHRRTGGRNQSAGEGVGAADGGRVGTLPERVYGAVPAVRGGEL